MFKKLFLTKKGKVVIGQTPNLPIIFWFFFAVLSILIQNPLLNQKLLFFSRASLFIWAYLEITEGVNMFRKLLGVVGLAYLVLSV